MNTRPLSDRVQQLTAIDWHRRLFDSLLPLPEGTSYNAYLIRGSQSTVLLDSVDPAMAPALLAQLAEIPRIDYIVSHHAEEDHSGTIPRVLERYPEAIVLTTEKARPILENQLRIAPERIRAVADGERLSLGDRTLRFIHTPWVHWPETMVSYLEEEAMLFTCDFFGAHLATSQLYASAEAGRIGEAAKRYYAEIMMPFRKIIQKNLDKLQDLPLALIAPGHGPVYDHPQTIFSAYRRWTDDRVENSVVLPFVSMHGTTRSMTERLTDRLMSQGIQVHPFDLAVVDIGQLALTLVDAATIVIGTPTVLTGPHPAAAYAAYLANLLRPKAKFVSIYGSFGWGNRLAEKLSALIPDLTAELLPPAIVRGGSWEDEIDRLAADIIHHHREAGLFSRNGETADVRDCTMERDCVLSGQWTELP